MTDVQQVSLVEHSIAAPALGFDQAAHLGTRQPQDALILTTWAQAGSKGCSGGSGPARQASGNVVRLEANLTDVQLRAALEPFRRRKVLSFDDVRAAFGAFADPADAVRCAHRCCSSHTVCSCGWAPAGITPYACGSDTRHQTLLSRGFWFG